MIFIFTIVFPASDLLALPIVIDAHSHGGRVAFVVVRHAVATAHRVHVPVARHSHPFAPALPAASGTGNVAKILAFARAITPKTPFAPGACTAVRAVAFALAARLVVIRTVSLRFGAALWVSGSERRERRGGPKEMMSG